MAQTGYTPISIYYSATTTNVPTAGNLVAGELAINTADGKLFYKDSAGAVQVIGTKGGVGSSSTTQILYNSSGLVVGSANLVTSTSSALSLTSQNSSGSTGTLRILDYSSNNSSGYIQWVNNAGSSQYGFVQGLSAGGLAFGNDSAEAMRINSSGALCINSTGTLSSEKLYVYSTGSYGVIVSNGNSATSGVCGVLSIIPSTAFNTNCNHFSGQTAGINTWYLYGNGATSYVSDRNLKKNIVTTRDGYLDDLAKLRIVKYQWKVNGDDSPNELGVIAQEVAEVFPNLVKDSTNLNEDGTQGETHKVVLGSVFQPILIKSVQELYDLVKQQANTINALQTQVSALQAKLG